MPEVILLLSGGIDSTTLLAELSAAGTVVHALSFNYGQRHLAELDYARSNAVRYKVLMHHVIHLDMKTMAAGSMLTNLQLQAVNYLQEPLPQQPSETYVPGRNLLMLSHAAAYAESKRLTDIYFAANADDGLRFPDCRSEFIAAINALLACCPNTAGIQVHTPFLKLSKAEVILKSIQLKVDLKQTISCYAPVDNNECGTCLSCVLKNKAINEILT